MPELWIWEVTPLKRGNTSITLKMSFKLKDKQEGTEKIHTSIIFNQKRPVDINYSYSISKFFTGFWTEISAFLFGSGSVAGFLKWYIEHKNGALKNAQIEEKEPKRIQPKIVDRVKKVFPFL